MKNHFSRGRSLAAISVLVAIGCANGGGDTGFLPPVGDDGSLGPVRSAGGVGQPSADASAERTLLDDAAAGDLVPDAVRGDGVTFSEPDALELPTAVDGNPDGSTRSVGDAGDNGTPDGDSGGGWYDASADGPAPLTPSVGDLLITEVMFYPWGPEPQSEWFEVYNLTGSPLLLSGLTIQDGYPRIHVIASNPPVIAPPFAYVLLVRNQLAATGNLLPATSVVYEYGAGLPADQGIQLQNGAPGDLSLWDGSTLLVDVPYGPWAMAFVGQSIELASLVYAASDTPAAWCVAQYAWAAGTDYGTPGSGSDCP